MPDTPKRPEKEPQSRFRGLTGAAAGCVAVVLVALLAAAGAGQEQVPQDADPEALLVRGIELFSENEFSEGLALLRAVRDRRPGWNEAARALGSALLRAGRHEEARPLYVELLGAGVAEGLADGTVTAFELPPGTDPDAVLGFGMVHELAGEAVTAERLYRTYADMVGPAEPEAARAYGRLELLFETADVPWGDARAESVKARAVDSRGTSGQALPSFPDAGNHPALEPYFRTIERSTERSDSLATFDEAPWLTHWEAVPPEMRENVTRRSVPVEVLVDSTGVPLEATTLDASLADSTAGRVVDAVSRWRFAPALRGGEPGASWIVVSALAPVPAGRGGAPDTTEAALPDTSRARAAPDTTLMGEAARDTIQTGDGPSRDEPTPDRGTPRHLEPDDAE